MSRPTVKSAGVNMWVNLFVVDGKSTSVIMRSGAFGTILAGGNTMKNISIRSLHFPLLFL